MDAPKTAASVFMCRLCNLFSPSREPLLDHCSQLHPQQDPPNDIIIPLQPLGSEPVESLAVGTGGTTDKNPAKRKRGRPKGSKNKTKAKSIKSQRSNGHSQEEGKKKEREKSCSPIEGENDGILELACKHCHRKFSNRRQILKHICLKEEEGEEDDEEKERVDVGAGEEGSGEFNYEKSHPSKKQNTGKSEKDTDGVRSKRNVRNNFSKEGDAAKENKKSIVNVVLTEDKTLPGVYKMVPVEDGSKGTHPAVDNSHTPQPGIESQSQDTLSEAPISDANPKTDQEPSSKPPSTTTTTTSTSRGFQEYSIKQDDNHLPPSHLKIFTCEFCNKIFKFRHSLVAHLRTHTQEKPFKCPHCEYASAIKANLNVHLRKHTGEKFSCPHCPFKCLSPGHLKVHIERVHLKVKQHCSFCEKEYGDVKNLLKHMENSHNVKDPEVYQCYQQLSLKTRQCLRQLLYNCPTCKRCFKHHAERERHLLVHGPLRPFACLLCDHAATKMDALVAHARKHLFLYVCSTCDGKFVSCQRLKSHLKESHPDLDQDQAFTSSIDNSYFLFQPGEDMRWDGGREDTGGGGRGKDEERNRAGGEMFRGGEAEQHFEVASKEVVEEGQGESVLAKEMREGENIAPDSVSVKVSAGGSAPADTKDSRTPAAGNTDGQEPNTTTCSSTERTLSEERVQENATSTHLLEGNSEVPDLGLNTSSSPAPSGAEDHTPHLAKESALFQQGAFQKVLSSLQKTQLNMETFQRLRKVYGDLECQYCGKLFWYKVQYNVHVRTHTKEHLHYCSKCDYSSITKSSLKRHQIQKHSGLLLPCSNPGCKYSTPDKYKLQAHQRTHQEEGKTVACPVCQQSFAAHKLKYHIKSSHPDSLPGRSKALMAQSAEKCPYCDAYFLRNSRDYKQHIWAHEGLKPYLCGLCDYAGRNRSNLKTHMNRHNTEKPHLCDLCGKKFKSKFTLKSHRQSHSKEGKRFQCSECDFTSVSKPTLLRHKEQHAEFKPFRCAHCHYTCNLTGPLKRHYRLKHPDQTYENTGPGLPDAEALKQQGGRKCPECDFVYGTKWELNRHLKSRHSLKEVEETWEAGETIEAQYVTVGEEELLTEAPVAVLHDNVNIQQISEFSSEAHDAVTSMVAMAPGTVTVVQQLQVGDEHEVDTCSNQLMVVNTNGDLSSEQVMVVEDAHGLEALTVLAEGDNTHHYIVYVQEHTVEIN